MELYLFAGVAVSDFTAALPWYERLFGAPPSSFPHDTEAVWQLGDRRAVYVVQRPEHAGHALHTIIVDDLDGLMAEIASRGLAPAEQETYGNGVRKTTYVDPDGNEIGFGGLPG